MKLLGGIFLIAGTCIGGGMLGLPIVTAQSGLLPATLLFVGCWILMAYTALLTLEVTLCFPKNSHIMTMAQKTLGKFGKLTVWTVYLLFLYSLVAAYISGGQDLLAGLLANMGIKIPLWFAGLCFVFVFGSIVVGGVKHVDLFNRLFMAGKLTALLLLMVFISTHVSHENFTQSNFKYLLPAMTVAITSFGFSVIVPTLRYYFHDDIKKLRWAILIGSFIPLVCYTAWLAVIFGTVPFSGKNSLSELINAAQPLTQLLASITYYVSSKAINVLAEVFTSICMLTAFICVSLALFDYLADGLNSSREILSNVMVTLATFLPPFLVTVFYPKAFIMFLSLAGVFCILLQALLPAMMAWSCRYVKKMHAPYLVAGGRLALIFSIVVCFVVAGIAGMQLV